MYATAASAENALQSSLEIAGQSRSRQMAVPVVNFIRLASVAESDDPLRDVGFLQKDLMGCERTEAFAMPTHDRFRP